MYKKIAVIVSIVLVIVLAFVKSFYIIKTDNITEYRESFDISQINIEFLGDIEYVDNPIEYAYYDEDMTENLFIAKIRVKNNSDFDINYFDIPVKDYDEVNANARSENSYFILSANESYDRLMFFLIDKSIDIDNAISLVKEKSYKFKVRSEQTDEIETGYFHFS